MNHWKTTGHKPGSVQEDISKVSKSENIKWKRL